MNRIQSNCKAGLIMKNIDSLSFFKWEKYLMINFEKFIYPENLIRRDE